MYAESKTLEWIIIELWEEQWKDFLYMSQIHEEYHKELLFKIPISKDQKVEVLKSLKMYEFVELVDVPF